TYTLMSDPERRRTMAESAVSRAEDFSLERFRAALDGAIAI
ncbi:MAG: hypothetical protein RL547_1455, partial [Actinomycetota bacterium]